MTIRPYASCAHQVWPSPKNEDDNRRGRNGRKKEKAQTLEQEGLTQEDFPRYAPAYDLIKASGLFPGFDWDVEWSITRGPSVKFKKYPREGGHPLPLAALVKKIKASQNREARPD